MVVKMTAKAKYYELDDITTPVRGQGFYCLSGATWVLLKGWLDYYGFWRTRYVKELETKTIEPVNDGEWSTILDALNLAESELANDMSCDLSEVFTQLSNAIEGLTSVAGGGCCSPAAYGTMPQDATDNTGDIDTQTPPTGFVDWASYQAYKCKAANKIVDDMISTIRNVGSLGGIVSLLAGAALGLFFNTSLLSGIVVGVMAIGFSAGTAAAIVIGALIAIAVAGGSEWTYFDDVADYFETYKETVVCRMFNATSPEDARTGMNTYLITAMASSSASFKEQFSGLITAILSYDVYNLLFENDSEVASYVGEIDCDDCDTGDFVWTLSQGTIAGSEDFEDIDDQWVIFDPWNPGNSQGTLIIYHNDIEGGTPLNEADEGPCNQYPSEGGGPLYIAGTQQTFKYHWVCDNGTVRNYDYPAGLPAGVEDNIYYVRWTQNNMAGQFAVTTNPALASIPPEGFTVY